MSEYARGIFLKSFCVRRMTVAAILGFSIVAGGPVQACGIDTDCLLGDRTYRIHLPAGRDVGTPIGAIVYMHGYRGTAAGIMRNTALRKLADKLGVALVAPKSSRGDWNLPNAPSGGDGSAVTFFDAFIPVLRERHGIDVERLMATGFSAGGMMVWNLACYRPNLFAGFAPIAGTFWAPVPPRCPHTPPHLVHIHGESDKVVPLTGRAIGPTRQGNVFRALAMVERQASYKPTGRVTSGRLSCERKRSVHGQLLEFCRHPGGHSIRTGWVAYAWQRLKDVGAIR
ncbi:MAG: PHB depolymerase family esterase [Pseudomonadota bacterium]